MIINLKESLTSTQESHPKREILKTKSPSSKKNIQITKSSPILDQGSTKKEMAIKPFWTEYSTEVSKRLWLPTKTDCPDSRLISLNQYVQSSEQKSSFSMTKKEMKTLSSQTISCPSSLFSPLDTTESVSISYARKIRIYPNKDQVNLFSKCFGTSRYMYNKGVDYINNSYKEQYNSYKEKKCCVFKECESELVENSFFCIKHQKKKLKWDLPLSLPKLRPLIMKSDKDLNEDEKWQSEVPYDVRQLSLKSLIGNYKACITNKKRGNITSFQLGFKSKKDVNQIFFNAKKSMKEFNIFKRRLKKKSKLKTRKRYSCYANYTPKHDYNILKEGNKYYVLLPKDRETKYTKAKYESVSLDPGVRTFQTYYSPEGRCGKIGDNIKNKIDKLNLKIDKFKSLITKSRNRSKYNMKERCSKLRTKIKNVVKDLHWHTCSYLVKNYDNIIIPSFGSKKMSKCEGRNISKGIVRSMLGLSHFKFLEKLRFKCKEYQRNLIIVTEEYTSKTCGGCGWLHNTLGSNKTFNCNKCDITIDRDINGARNILLKYLTGLDTTR